MKNPQHILSKQWQGGCELYSRNGVLSGDAAARAIRTVLDIPCAFTDFDCKTPDEPLSFERFEQIADSIANREVGVDPLLKQMFDSVGGQSDSLFVTLHQIRQAIEAAGVRADDPRLGDLGTALCNGNPNERLTPSGFLALVSSNLFLVSRILRHDLAVPNFEEFCTDLDSLYELVEPAQSGTNADYIPVLRDADPERWGVAFCSVDGQRYARGCVRDFFSIQSTSKPITYGLALSALGSAYTHNWVGMEPSGRAFNDPALLPDYRPFNPMVNAGAIMTCSVLASAFPEATPRELIDRVGDVWARMSGGVVRLSEETMLSEKATADNNFALAYLMRGRKGLPAPLEPTLDLYFGLCSLELTCDSMAVAAATLANGGVCPITGERIFTAEVVKAMLSLMASSGMYNNAGEFFFHIGIPAKSGVSGVVMVVVPNFGGFATFSPRLDSFGNSVRGVDFFRKLVANFTFHTFDNVSGGFNGFKKDPSGSAAPQANRRLLRWAAEYGDEAMQKLHALFVRTLAAVALTCGSLDEVGVRRVQGIYAGCMRSFLTHAELTSMAIFSNPAAAVDELCEEIARTRPRLDTRAGELLFEGALLLLSRTHTDVARQAQLLQRLARSFELSEETTEFLIARWGKMNLEEVLAARGVDLSNPIEPDLSRKAIDRSPAEPPPLSSEDTIHHIRESWEFVSRRRDHVAKLMYARLLWTDESAAVLFLRTDMEQQTAMLTHMLDSAVSQLDAIDEIAETVRELGRRHVSYNIRPEHYASVGASLLWALEHALSRQRWTDPVETAWKTVYEMLMNLMLEGDRQARNAAEDSNTPLSSHGGILVDRLV